MAAHEELLLQQILSNQDKHEKKLDDIREEVQGVKDNLGTTEQRIMGNVRREFVRHEEFPRLWTGQLECRQKKSIEKLELGTRIVGHVKTWAGWILAGALFIAARSGALSALFGR